MHRFLAIPALLTLFLTMTSAGRDTDRKYAIINNDDTSRLEAALQRGAQVVVKMKHVTVLAVEDSTMEALSLAEDLPVRIADEAVNWHIGADLLYTAGKTGAGRRVVILDTGIDYGLPELSSSYLGGHDFVNNDDDPLDDNGHGTCVTGIMAADGVLPEARGVAPDVGIIAGKVLDSAGNGFLSTIVEGIYWAVDGADAEYGTSDDFNPDVISMSLSTVSPTFQHGNCDAANPPMTRAIDYALSRNVSVVAAAGNNGAAGVGIPGCISDIITVGAIDFDGNLADFSAQGRTVDIVAPGVGVLSCFPNESYGRASGTSASTPIVSGTIALMKAEHADYSVKDVENTLFQTAIPYRVKGWKLGYGHGRLDAYAAVMHRAVKPSPASGRISGVTVERFELLQNYPNPFNPVTVIRYALPRAAQVKLNIFNALGQRVAVLADQREEAGYHEIRFDGANLPGGVYFCKITSGEFSDVKKVVLMK